MTVQGFITIKWQEKKLSMIKIFQFLLLTTLRYSILHPADPGFRFYLISVNTRDMAENGFKSCPALKHVHRP